MNILSFNKFYLVGIKGVAMTSLAQCLLDAGKVVRGSDLEEEFVTQEILDKLKVKIDYNFETKIPKGVDCLIYTAAHGGPDNPQVMAAKKQSIPIFSQAEALASLFNPKKGIAVCGVGGKSTTSAMITWIMNKVQPKQLSFSVGVGDIPGIGLTGKWSQGSQYFIAEADEYVIDPQAIDKGEKIVPRFSFLKPQVSVCTNIKFDHPDVYRDLDHTQQTYYKFFDQLKPDGVLIFNADDPLQQEYLKLHPSVKVQTYGTDPDSSLRLLSTTSQTGKTSAKLLYQGQKHLLELRIPGQFNVMNALAAALACQTTGINLKKSIKTLKDFRSTKRRFEYIGKKNGVEYYDDYAHHPDEVTAAIKALKEWYPNSRRVIAFQSHTYSRTRELMDEFVEALSIDDEVVLIDIFPSAREKTDLNTSSDLLVENVKDHHPKTQIENLKTIKNLAKFCKQSLKDGDVMITLGAGDIYLVHQAI